MVSGGDAEQLRQARDGSTGEVADRVNTLAVEDGPGPAADTPQRADGQAVQEVDGGWRGDEQEAVGLSVRGGDLSDRLGGGDTHGGGQAHALSDA